MLDEEALLSAARGGDSRAYDVIAGKYRRELAGYCYRFLGSPIDAEDAVQEALFAAWRGLPGFEGRSSLRSWLYRITTNVCLRLSTHRTGRLLSPDRCPPRRASDDVGEPVPGPVWLEPWPDDVPGDTPGPDALYLSRESVELAFVAALQHLPATQRAVLLLREVLQFSAAEVADLLDTTPASVNSALQRARDTVRNRVPHRSQQVELAALGEAETRRLVDAFVDAWQRADVDALVALLTEDVRFAMPPLPAWFDGRPAVLAFMRQRVLIAPWWLVRIAVNQQLAFACYQQDNGTGVRPLAAVNVLEVHAGRIHTMTGFLDPATHAALSVPPTLPPPSGDVRAER